jgi:hypothetical protein
MMTARRRLSEDFLNATAATTRLRFDSESQIPSPQAAASERSSRGGAKMDNIDAAFLIGGIFALLASFISIHSMCVFAGPALPFFKSRSRALFSQRFFGISFAHLFYHSLDHPRADMRRWNTIQTQISSATLSGSFCFSLVSAIDNTMAPTIM